MNRLGEIFFPYAYERTVAMVSGGDRFVYYTTAEVAASLLSSQQIWLRNALMMNDFREIAHGWDCLRKAYDGPAGFAFKTALAACHPALPGEIELVFNSLLPVIYNDTFIYCVSEHSQHEDVRGRLSMWRAYGGRNGVALVINGAPMHGESHVLGVYSSPVLYADPPEFGERFMRLALRIAGEVEYLKMIGRDAVKDAVFQMLRFSVLCTKHPGFQEEREWRVIASPTMFPSDRVESGVEVIRGIPQQVLKIRLENIPEHGLKGLDLPTLLDRVIVGPSEFPVTTAKAFSTMLAKLGIARPDERVVVSDIPLRHDR